MDFHCLPRRALQFLCKRNGIPANITSVAMADALLSLQTVEGLNELEQKTPIRPPNPPRSCKRNSTLTSTRPSRPRKKTETSVQELRDGSMPDRGRAVRPRNASSRTDAEEEDDDPIGNPMLRCSSSVRQNATAFESDEPAAVEVGAVEERRRSIGIQVDIVDQLVAELPDAKISPRPPNSVESSRCLELFKNDHSCIDKEFSNSSCLQNLQIATHLAQQSPVRSNMAADVCHHISSQQAPLLVVGDQITESHEIDASVGGLAWNCDVVLEKVIGGENGEGKSCGGTSVETKVSGSTQNSLEFNQSFDLVKKDREPCSSLCGPTNGALDNERIDSSHLQGLQVDNTHLPEQSPELSRMPSTDGDHIGTPHAPILENGDPTVKYHEPNVSVGAVALNCDPISENSVGIHSKDGEANASGGMRVEIKVEKKSEKYSEKRSDLSGLSLRKLRLLYKENKNVIKLEAEEGTVPSEEQKLKVDQTELDGLSLRKLKFLYKNKVHKSKHL